MVECKSAIAEVCVYPGQAQIVRRGRVELEAGSREIVLSDLPLSLQPETVRVAGRGTAVVRLLGVEVSQARYALPPEEEVLELDRRIEQLEDQDRALSGRVEALNHRLQVLSGLGDSAAERLPWGIARGQVDTAGVEELLASLHRDEQAVREEIRQLEVERRKVGRELEQMRRKRQDRAQPRSPDRYVIRVPVEVERGGEFELEVTYVCQRALWKPLYDLRLDEKAEGGPRVTLGQLAEVRQATGEDWSGVKLAVSTARPALAARLPELSPWYIDMYRPAVERAVRAAAPAPRGMLRVGAEEAEAKAEPEAPPPPVVEAAVAEAEVRTEGPAVVFVAPGTPSIPADNSPHKVYLGTQVLPAPLDWVTAPKVEAHVYRRAKVQNTSPAILLPGQGSVFYGDTFIGNTQVPETPPKDDFELYLGVDDQVRVERELTDRAVDKSGLLEKVRRMHFAYSIKVRNLREDRLPLTVLDQIPLSRHESLKVKLLRSDPEVEPGGLGELRWELSLAPGEEREITFAFQVDMPLEGEVVGLP